MDEGLDNQLSIAALVLVVLLLAAQVVLMAGSLWLPMAGVTNQLLEDEPDAWGPVPAPGQPGQAAPEPPPGPTPWRWAAYSLSALCLLIAGFAVWRLRSYSQERLRWTWVMTAGVVGAAVGIFAAWIMVRQALMFQHFGGQ